MPDQVFARSQVLRSQNYLNTAGVLMQRKTWAHLCFPVRCLSGRDSHRGDSQSLENPSHPLLCLRHLKH